jgi:hypothetical protein
MDCMHLGQLTQRKNQLEEEVTDLPPPQNIIIIFGHGMDTTEIDL